MENDNRLKCVVCGSEVNSDVEGLIALYGDLKYRGKSIFKLSDEDLNHPRTPYFNPVSYVCIDCLIKTLEGIREQAIEDITKKMSKEQERLDKLMLSMVNIPKEPENVSVH